MNDLSPLNAHQFISLYIKGFPKPTPIFSLSNFGSSIGIVQTTSGDLYFLFVCFYNLCF